MTGQLHARIGQILQQHGELTGREVDTVIAAQRDDGRPFGALAQQMFGLSNRAIERAWVQQYLTYNTQVNLRQQRVDPRVMEVLNRRQAWQFQMQPLRREDGCLVVATCAERLPRATTFAWRQFDEPVFFVVASKDQLLESLSTHYPWPEMAGRVIATTVEVIGSADGGRAGGVETHAAMPRVNVTDAVKRGGGRVRVGR